MDKTYVLKGKQEPEWLLVDAAGQGVGRLATQIAAYLIGKTQTDLHPWCGYGGCGCSDQRIAA